MPIEICMRRDRRNQIALNCPTKVGGLWTNGQQTSDIGCMIYIESTCLCRWSVGRIYWGNVLLMCDGECNQTQGSPTESAITRWRWNASSELRRRPLDNVLFNWWAFVGRKCCHWSRLVDFFRYFYDIYFTPKHFTSHKSTVPEQLDFFEWWTIRVAQVGTALLPRIHYLVLPVMVGRADIGIRPLGDINGGNVYVNSNYVG